LNCFAFLDELCSMGDTFGGREREREREEALKSFCHHNSIFLCDFFFISLYLISRSMKLWYLSVKCEISNSKSLHGISLPSLIFILLWNVARI
jgi:hypothetical protein